jgi:hypothetical protein
MDELFVLKDLFHSVENDGFGTAGSGSGCNCIRPWSFGIHLLLSFFLPQTDDAILCSGVLLPPAWKMLAAACIEGKGEPCFDFKEQRC